MSSAASERRGLGRGFEVLIGGSGEPELAHVPVEQIHANPRQPRRRFDHEATAGLADSIRAQGVIQPVVLRPRMEVHGGGPPPLHLFGGRCATPSGVADTRWPCQGS